MLCFLCTGESKLITCSLLEKKSASRNANFLNCAMLDPAQMNPIDQQCYGKCPVKAVSKFVPINFYAKHCGRDVTKEEGATINHF